MNKNRFFSELKKHGLSDDQIKNLWETRTQEGDLSDEELKKMAEAVDAIDKMVNANYE